MIGVRVSVGSPEICSGDAETVVLKYGGEKLKKGFLEKTVRLRKSAGRVYKGMPHFLHWTGCLHRYVTCAVFLKKYMR